MANTLKFGNGEWYGKKDTILAYNDENSNYKPLPFNFTRASSATRVNKDGLIETVGSGIPRIDFQGNTKGALLLEPQRTNYQPYSTIFSSWGVVDVTVGLNYGLSPDGFNNSVLITEGTGSTQHRIVKGSPASSGIYTLSCFVKNKVGNRQAYIDMGAVTGFFNFDTETMFSAAGTTSVESWSNGWYRISITSNTNVTPTVNYLGTGKNNSETFQGDGSSAIEFFAPQLEQGSYATSYIPTQGSAVTRLADSCSQTVPDGVIGQTEGTMYAEIDFKSKPEAGSPIVSIMTLNNNVNNLQNCIILGIERQSEGVNRFYPFVQVSNSTVANVIGGTLTDGIYKVAFAYKQNDFVLYVNGVQIGTDTNGVVPTTSQVLVGERYNTDTYKIADGIKETKLYNTRLSNSELAALTS